MGMGLRLAALRAAGAPLLIAKRQSAFIRHWKDSLVHKFWRSKVQRDIKISKSLYYHDRINDPAQSNAKKWWQWWPIPIINPVVLSGNC